MAEDVLLIHCAHCREPVALKRSDWPVGVRRDGLPMPDDHPLQTVARWECPHCDKENAGGFPGRIALAKKGHGPDGRWRFPAATGWKGRED